MALEPHIHKLFSEGISLCLWPQVLFYTHMRSLINCNKILVGHIGSDSHEGWGRRTPVCVWFASHTSICLGHPPLLRYRLSASHPHIAMTSEPCLPCSPTPAGHIQNSSTAGFSGSHLQIRHLELVFLNLYDMKKIKLLSLKSWNSDYKEIS